MTNTRQANLSHAVALFEQQARLAPEAIALEEGDVAWTYQDLNTRANKIAAALLGLGCTAETRVAVYLERSREWAASLLGILKAGAVYVPLDPHYPSARVAYMLTDSRPALVLTDRSLRNQLLANTGADQTKTLDLEDVPQIEALDPVIQLSPRQLAYIIYTSGSTGRPKGAMVEHRGLRNHLLAKVEDLGLGPSDAVAQNSPSSFDVSVWQVLAALVSGGRIRIVPEETAQDSERLLEECESHRITVLETVPAMLALMAEQQRERGAGRLPLARLRSLICNAEALPVTLCREWLSLYPRMNLVNAYGPTECSDDVTHYHVPAGIEGSGTALLGAPLRSTSIYIDGSGTEGEILIGGIGVGRGYFERPDLTAEKFVPDPFGSEPGARLYRTGDLGRWNDENLEFLGRIDHQVKLRGFRIELGEIEALLHQQSGVRHAVALVRPDLSGEPALFAWVAGLPGIDTDFLLDRLREALPNCMVPSAIIHVETFPVSPNGKIDRQALALPRHPSSAQPSLVGARTETEVAIAAIWADVLKREVIGVEDTFFSVGGNSLQAAQVASRIRRHFSLDLPLRRLYEKPTVALLASEVDRARSTAETKSRFRMNQLSNGYERRPGWGFRRVGHGTSCGHHGEIFQGQLENSHGDAHRCLLSLPCYDLYARAVFTPDSTSSIRVEPAGKLKSKRAVEMTIRALDVPSCGGVLTIHNNIEESKGYGSSTADCVAAVLATADAFGHVFADHEVARLVVAAETASDNIMFARAVLFAQREGRVLEDYGAPFPHLVVLGVDTDEIGRVDTLDCEPTRYSWEQTCRFRPLIAGLRRALRRHDLDLLCRIATASAVINQQFLPKPMFADLLSLAKSCDVPGVAVAHSGTVLSFLLDGARPGVERITERLRRELESFGLTRVFCFHTTRSRAAFLAV